MSGPKALLVSNFVLFVFLQKPTTCKTTVISPLKGCSIFDFEKNPLERWMSSGDAFEYNPIMKQDSLATNHHGNWLINSKLNMTSPCRTPSYQVRLKGALMSPLFEIRDRNLTFLIGGGCNVSATRVELVINGITKFKVTGDCKETMSRKFWNTGSYLGHLAQIKIIDESDDLVWGYISFDDVRTSTSCEDLQPCKSNNKSMCQEEKDAKKEILCSCNRRNLNSLPCGAVSRCNISGGSCHNICAIHDCACQECSCKRGYQFNKTSSKCEDIDECESNSGSCQYACVNTLGGYHCKCKDGFRLGDDRKSCVDIDECKLTKDGGCVNSLCSNSDGSFQCVCFQGWAMNLSDPLRCVDIDECAHSSPCSSLQSCVNTLGSFDCNCQPGYKKGEFRNKCVDVNECQTMNGGCDQICQNTPGSFKCLCNSGYIFSSIKRKCVDINECKYDNGGCDQRCYNKEGNNTCGCNPGYSLGNDSVSCLDIDECLDDSSCSHICSNTLGSYKCSCYHGYQLHHDNKNCFDVDECLSDNGYCDHTCQNDQGSYYCMCNSGFKLHDNGRTCIDIDECLSTNPCQQQCINTEGSFQCSCSPGFKLSENGTNCQDINECELNSNQVCSHTCINTIGSYRCACQSGYSLNSDNSSCSDINECNYSNPCQQVCVNEPGSYKCSCNQGYTIASNKKTCEDVNECDQIDTCDQRCINTRGSYQCLCLEGYHLADDNMTCKDIDECQGKTPCQELCRNVLGSYQCLCRGGKVIQSDGKTCKDPVSLNKAVVSAKKDVQEAKSSNEIARATKTMSESVVATEVVTSSDIKGVVEFINNVELKLKDIQFKSAQEAGRVVENIMELASNILDDKNQDSWKGLSEGSKLTRLPGQLERFGSTIFESAKKQDISEISYEFKNRNVDSKLIVQQKKKFKGFQYETNMSKVLLDECLFKGPDDNETAGVFVAAYKSLSQLTSENVISDVVSVNFLGVDQNCLGIPGKQVVLTFKPRKQFDVLPLCSFILENSSCPELDSCWSTNGCWMNSSQDGETICMCNHTTSYGLLMDVHGIYDSLDSTHKDALRYISLIGCCVSICFCALTVLALSLTMRHPMEKKARHETFKLHINLVVAIGLSQVWFVIGSFLVNVDLVACRVVSIFTHYFLTASFCWMLVEGINVYNKIVKVFSTKKYGKFYFTLGWGFPLIMVIVTSAAVFHKYGPHNICWLHKDVIWVFAVPVLVVIVANLFVLLSVVYVLLRKTMSFSATPNKPKGNPKVKRTVKVTVVLLPLLGLTWVFGFLAIDRNFIVFHYLFAIINSLQGFFIFVAHCWNNDTIRSALLAKLPSLPLSNSKYRSSTNSAATAGDGDCQKASQIESNAFDNDTFSSVPMPVHITMSTVQLLNLTRNSPETSRRSDSIKDYKLPGFAQ